MARLIRSDGTEEIVKPEGKKWTLKELQALVGGYIEFMPGIGNTRMILNEEGLIKDLPRNYKATDIVLELLKRKPLRYVPELRGDVVILEKGEKT